MRDNGLKVFGLLLCAGFSERMGAFKPLLEFDNKSFLENIVIKLDAVCDKIIIVTGHRNRDIQSIIETKLNYSLKDKINLVFNENYDSGMFSSLKAGIENALNADWVLYHFIDQPNLPNEFYNDFINQIDDKSDWIQPEYNNRKGHPLLFSRLAMDLILDNNEKQNLRDISPDIKNKKIWNCDYKEILIDIDTPGDYKYIVNANSE